MKSLRKILFWSGIFLVILTNIIIKPLGNLDEIDRKILETMIEKYGGRPVGIDTLATTVGEEVETIEDVYQMD